jgi:hypothetical protein
LGPAPALTTDGEGHPLPPHYSPPQSAHAVSAGAPSAGASESHSPTLTRLTDT